MSYCRWSDGDLYVYHDVGGFLICMCCSFTPVGPTGWHGDFTTTSRKGMASHVREHIAAGHDADEDVAKELENESAVEGDEIEERSSEAPGPAPFNAPKGDE